jgi:hypothetical protein
MSSERYNQIIDETYKNFKNSFPMKKSNPPKDYINSKGQLLTKDQFIDKCKTDNEFSEKWGLKIEERELSLGERGELFRKTYPYNSVDDFAPSGMEIQSLSHQLNTRYEKAKIPTKLITLTYNDETIEIYE